jgi:hypothetical protein
MKSPICFSLLLVAVLASSTKIDAQVSTIYSFSQDTVPYTRITGGTVLASATEDDQAFTNLPIGFTFPYNNTNYTSMGVSTNGYVVLGSGNITTSYMPISSALNGNLISAMGADLQLGYRFVASATNMSSILTVTGSAAGVVVGAKISGAGIPVNTTVVSINGQSITLSQNATQTTNGSNYTTAGELRFETIGTAPNRICVIQWNTIMKFMGLGSGDCFNFQIRLHETTGKIETTYDILAVNQNEQTFQIGLRGITNIDFNSRQTNNNWQTTSASLNANNACTLNAQTIPLSGLTYVWTVGNVGINERVQNTFILFPNPCQQHCQIEFEKQTQVNTIAVFAINGQLLHQENINMLRTQINLDLSRYVAGIYFVQVTTPEGTSTKRLIIN